MKRDQNFNCLTAAVLSFCLSFGGVACMVTGIKLEVTSLWLLALVCAAAAVFSALCFRWKHGGWVLLICAVLGCMAFSRDLERIALYIGQVRAMLNRMTTLWNNAYGWGRIPAGEETLSDLPLVAIGSFVAIVVARTVCRRKRAAVAVGISLLPLGSCLVVTDTVPDTGFLFLLLLGLAVLILTNSVRRQNLRQGLELTAMASVAAALGLGLLFGWNPRETYVNQTEEIQEAILTWAQDLPAALKEWGQEHAPGNAQTGQTQRENLATLGRRIERNYPVLEVTADISGILYLRGQDFDSYDGRTWTATRNRSEEFLLPASFLTSDTGAQITIDALRYRTVRYVPYYPQSGESFLAGRISNEEKQQVYQYTLTTLAPDWKDKLQAVSFVPDQNATDGIFLTAGLYDSTRDQWRYRTLPLDTQSRAKTLVNEILSNENTVVQKADAIADYVRSSARYDLDPGTMPREETDFALWFLEDQEEGYCVHFATAAVVLLRAAGIDARYVTGYVLQAQAGQTVEVSAKQAHAWAEYFEPRLGTWVVLEATPPDFANWDSPEQTQTVPGTEGLEETEEPSQPSMPQATRSSEGEPTDPFIRFEEGPEKASVWIALWNFLKKCLSPVLAAALFWGQYRLRRSLRRKQQRRGHPNGRALALWREIQLIHRLLGTMPPEELEGLAQRARFSQHTLTKDQLAALEEGIFRAGEELRAKSWYLRLIYRFVFAAY